MKILYVMRYWPVYGGGETITATLANEFVKRGHDIHIAYTYDNVCTPMPYQIDSRIKSVKLFTIEGYTKKDVEKLHQYVLSNGIEVMINQWGSTKLCYEAKQDTTCKLVTCWHLDVFQKVEEPKSIKERALCLLFGHTRYVDYMHYSQMKRHNLNYKLSDKYVFLSTLFLDEYLEKTKLKIDIGRVDAIANPLTYDFNFDMTSYSSKEKKVLFVGRIYEYHKRLSYVLKIWKQIENDKHFDNWSLSVVGDGPDMQVTKNLAKELQLQRVSFEGFKKPNEYYAQSSLFIMTSAFEGFGMTLVEAQQYGVVCIAMDSYKSLHDILQNNKNGIIVENDDINGFVKALKCMMSDDDLRKKFAFAGLESCKKFSIDCIASRWEKLLMKL